MRRLRLLAVTFICAMAVGTPVLAAQVIVINGWFRRLPANLPAAGYFELRNLDTTTATLRSAESPACGMLMLHKSSETGGMSSMADVSNVPIFGGATMKFAPGGYHLMCMNATAAMKLGANVPVTLKFSDGSTATGFFTVRNARGQ